MIDQEQAHQIADELLSQQRQQLLDEKNAKAGRVALIYQCTELRRLSPVERSQVVLEAKQALWRGHWLTTLALLSWMIFFAGFIVFVLTPEQRSSFFDYWLFLLCIPPFILYVAIVRLHVKYLARVRAR